MVCRIASFGRVAECGLPAPGHVALRVGPRCVRDVTGAPARCRSGYRSRADPHSFKPAIEGRSRRLHVACCAGAVCAMNGMIQAPFTVHDAP